MNILFASSEVAPFAKTGGLADVSGSLPKALGEISCRVSVITPFYKRIRKMRLNPGHFSIGSFDFLTHKEEGIDYIFVVNDKYYDRDNLYSEPTGDYEDNDLRFSYFARAIAVLGIDASRGFDIIHSNDWQTGLVPLYLKIHGVDVKTLFSIHNLGYQGLFKQDSLYRVGIPRRFYNIDGIEYYGKISFLKAGIVYSSAIATVSKGYSEEILTPEFGCGMEGILKTRASDIYGIVNGVDYTKWDPKIDGHIAEKYDIETIDKKLECKKDLIKSVKLAPETIERPLIGVISRLAHQKGIDLIVEAAGDIIRLGASIVILGTGDDKYNKLARLIEEKHPLHISSHIKFDNELAHKIEAGSDIFVMPSRYEPCGLNQLYSMRYGTLPVVRRTGGLNDTVIDIDEDRASGNGIKFSGATKKDLIEALSRAVRLYGDKDAWRELQKRIMGLDFSWEASASRYKELYEKLLG